MAVAVTFQRACPNPSDAIRIIKAGIPDCLPHQVLVEMLAIPINPLDLLVLQGRYPVKPKIYIEDEMVAGSDGAGKVTGLGSDVQGLALGDTVILKQHCQGTWRTHAALDARDLIKVPTGTDPVLAAVVRMGILPAYFQLEDYQRLTPGDWIIQNAGTGVVAHFVTQLAALRGVRVISVIRDRANADLTKKRLLDHGASIVLTETELDATKALDGIEIKLAIDAVSGSISAKMASKLTKDSTFLTAGFLGSATTGEVGPDWKTLGWSQGIVLQGFRLSSCIAARSARQMDSLVEWFANLLKQGLLTRPFLYVMRWDSGTSEHGVAEAEEMERTVKDAVDSTYKSVVGSSKVVLVLGQ